MQEVKINGFEEGMSVESFFVVKDASLLSTASGKPFIRMSLGDSTGTIQSNVWDNAKELFDTFSIGNIIKVRGQVESYRGNLQLKVNKLRPAHESEVDFSSFVGQTPADLDALEKKLFEIIDSLEDADYKALLHSFFDNEEMLAAFRKTPAASGNHHAYIGGLMEHTLSLVAIAEGFCATSTTSLNRSLLLTGCFLHDIGKTRELTVGTSIEYTTIGKLIGHLTIGAMMVEKNASELEGFPEIKKQLVQHLILSHHGRFEYGSPVLPAIPEALALHHIDNLDAKTIAARRLIDEDPDSEREWTDRSWMLETRLFKGSLK